MRAIMWSSDKGDLPFSMPLTNNLAATTDPGVTNDSSQGYEVGSQWVNKTAGRSLVCMSNTAGAAVWSIDGSTSNVVGSQSAPQSQDTAATLTAAQILGGILTTAPAGAIAGAINLQLPLATALDTAFGAAPNNTSIDFSIINTAGAANTATVTTNTGWTLVGSMAVAQNVSGAFRARKTGAGAWTLYRVS